MKIQIPNEYSRLKCVVLGTANSCGGPPHLDDTYDPKTKEYLRKGMYPYEKNMVSEMESFAEVLLKHDVEVLRPTNIDHLNQIFTRDICFVIEDKLVMPEIIKERQQEIDGIQDYIKTFKTENILRAPDGVRIEGGDVIIHNEYLFVGYANDKDFYGYKTARTNENGLNFLKEKFPDKKVLGIELNKSDYEPRENALHLDCCFQPLGLGHALIFEDGFKNQTDLDKITEIFGSDKLIKVSREEMYTMGCNVLSVAKNLVISERGFIRINDKLRSLGYTVEEIPYYQISKLEGLLRCSTLPLLREDE
ncbi:arginine deiminase family protein [Bacteroidia bacterium]|nr:arginine deiminase family protein [Bacteroidia bacterium]MDC1395044.1 arginine deiminase family protein [Bacteroidia bacterium]